MLTVIMMIAPNLIQRLEFAVRSGTTEKKVVKKPMKTEIPMMRYAHTVRWRLSTIVELSKNACEKWTV
eukprot:TRINITY_DN5824_c0_g1_i1.p4 TRINITY_DN5824_c0_g1~~TRINITY_DN5824_c0_g1_i1.p4  ORF type:complete len:68 (+),score=7.27 TRINITY_DN5824_c0_g1_i1:347-550(+)